MSLNPYKSENKFIARVKISILLTIASLMLLLALDVYQHGFGINARAVAFSLLGLILLYIWLNEDTVQIVNGIILWGASTLVFYFAWINLGLFDVALFGYPCIVLLGFIVGSKTLFIPLLLTIACQLFLLFLAHALGLFPEIGFSDVSYLSRSAKLLIVFMLFGITSYIYISGFKYSLKKEKRLNRNHKRQLQRSNKLLQIDYLTKLPNERIFQKDVNELLLNMNVNEERLAIYILDISNIKQIINSLGYEIGDVLFFDIAKRLNSILSPQEYLYRMHGSEFALVKLSEHPEEINIFKERLLQAITSDFTVNEHEVSVKASVGIVVAPFDGVNLAALMKRAHLAIQYGVEESTSSAFYFEQYMQDKEDERYFFLASFKKALDNDEFELFYQPKINLNNDHISGVEALIRWKHPEKGYIPPDKFIAIAEESGFISEITKWVIKQACIDCVHWQNQGFKEISVAVNLSAIDFRRGNLPQVVLKALNSSKLTPNLLELEITESIIFDDLAHIQSQIQQLQSKGITFAIDDFGTGYSNLGYLSKFNVSTLKIDKSFVIGVASKEHEQHIVKAIIDMSKSLGIRNVAEGVEDDATTAWLLDNGCDFGQGYYWSKPVKLNELLGLFKDKISK